MNKNGINSWPRSERPREALLEKGPDAVSDAGLVAILLRNGSQGEDAVALARKLLKKFGGLGGLLHASKSELEKVRGIGSAKAASLMAAMEIAKRKVHEDVVDKDITCSPEEVFRLLSPAMKGLKKEVFKVLYLDQANHVLAIEDVFEGTANQSAVYPREIIKRALELEATGIIFAHNHPGGTCKPSKDDIELTKKLFKACDAVEIRALDHIIIAGNAFVSLNESGHFS